MAREGIRMFGERSVGRASGLAALAACAVLLAACGGDGAADGGHGLTPTPAAASPRPAPDPGVVDLPAYDPDPGTAGAAFVYSDGRLEIRAIDGAEVHVGPGHWSRHRNSYLVYPDGPDPVRKQAGFIYYLYDRYDYDSALLGPGEHTITVAPIAIAPIDPKDMTPGAFKVSVAADAVELSFVAEQGAYYKLVRIGADGDKTYWPVVIKGVCPLNAGAWKWPLEWECYRRGPIVASRDPGHIGKRVDEVF